MGLRRREALSLFIVDGEVMANCTYAEYRTSPALGGASVMRETIPIPEDIYVPTLNLVAAIGLEGLCEVEFRRDAAGRPLLMEINARLVGGIETAIRAGVDFPLLTWQWAAGLPVDRVERYRTGVRARWLHGELRWLRDNYHRVGRPDSVSRSRALWLFASEFARTRHYDCFNPRDLRPVMTDLRNTATIVLKSRKSPAGRTRREYEMSTTEVLIVGAGAFGLSISAHLRALGVEHVIAGRPMDTWRGTYRSACS